MTVQNENMKHDEGYRKIFAHKDSFLHFLNKYIEAPWIDGITADDLEQIKTTYVGDDLQKRESDIIYKVNSKNVFFYTLLELQSEPDFTMPWRLLKYVVNLLSDVFMNTDKNERKLKDFKLPAVVPIVLYNGEDNWTPVKSFKEYTANYGDFGDNILDLKYILFDLNRYNEEDILKTYKLLDFVFQMDLKHYSRDDKEIIEEMKRLIKLPHELSPEDILNFGIWLRHALGIKDESEDFVGKVVTAFQKGEVEDMTYALGRWADRKVSAAREEEKIFLASKLMKRGRPIEEIMEDTGLSREKIERLQFRT